MNKHVPASLLELVGTGKRSIWRHHDLSPWAWDAGTAQNSFTIFHSQWWHIDVFHGRDKWWPMRPMRRHWSSRSEGSMRSIDWFKGKQETIASSFRPSNSKEFPSPIIPCSVQLFCERFPQDPMEPYTTRPSTLKWAPAGQKEVSRKDCGAIQILTLRFLRFVHNNSRNWTRLLWISIVMFCGCILYWTDMRLIVDSVW